MPGLEVHEARLWRRSPMEWISVHTSASDRRRTEATAIGDRSPIAIRSVGSAIGRGWFERLTGRDLPDRSQDGAIALVGYSPATATRLATTKSPSARIGARDGATPRIVIHTVR